MDKALQDIQAKLSQLYARLEAVNAEIDRYPTAELMKRVEVLDAEIDLVIDQLLDAENQAASGRKQEQ
jgi:uncharacterized coiled-coil protein SlyX